MDSQIIVNELLAFIQNAIGTMDESSIVQVCKSTFTEEDICSSKALFFQSLGKTAEMPSRRRDGGVKSLRDIITMFAGTDSSNVPSFVAKQLHKLPSVTFDHVDVTGLLKDIALLKKTLVEVQSRLEVSNNTIIELRSEVALLRSANSECRSITNTSNVDARVSAAGGGADSVKLDLPVAEPASPAPRPAARPSVTSDPARTSRVSVSTPGRAYAAIAATRPTPSASKTKPRTLKGEQVQREHPRKDLPQPAPREPRCDKDGFIEVVRKRKPPCRNQRAPRPPGLNICCVPLCRRHSYMCRVYITPRRLRRSWSMYE